MRSAGLQHIDPVMRCTAVQAAAQAAGSCFNKQADSAVVAARSIEASGVIDQQDRGDRCSDTEHRAREGEDLAIAAVVESVQQRDQIERPGKGEVRHRVGGELDVMERRAMDLRGHQSRSIALGRKQSIAPTGKCVREPTAATPYFEPGAKVPRIENAQAGGMHCPLSVRAEIGVIRGDRGSHTAMAIGDHRMRRDAARWLPTTPVGLPFVVVDTCFIGNIIWITIR